jgi:hypothetical protein
VADTPARKAKRELRRWPVEWVRPNGNQHQAVGFCRERCRRVYSGEPRPAPLTRAEFERSLALGLKGEKR